MTDGARIDSIAMNGGGLTIRPVALGGASVGDWLRAKTIVHRDDPAFVAPLPLFEKRRIDPRHSPFFEHGRAGFFVAYRGSEPVGRISAQISMRDPAFQRDRIGQFGFFDAVEDDAVAGALFGAARAWLRDQGATSMRGPFNLSINEECGCQIDGFGLPATYLMPQSRPWTAGLIAGQGLIKAVDTQAWRVTPSAISERVRVMGALGAGLSHVRARPFRKEAFNAEIRLLADIFNDAWSENWGFVPFSSREIDALAAELKLIYRSSYGYFVEIDGEAVAVFIGIPNMNELIAPLRGRLTPVGAARFAWNLFTEGARSSRIPLAGIRKKYQLGANGALIGAAFASQILKEVGRRPVDWFELSWVLETNLPARRFLAAIGATPAITYRLFEGPVTGR
jgi:hypothetical protein